MTKPVSITYKLRQANGRLGGHEKAKLDAQQKASELESRLHTKTREYRKTVENLNQAVQLKIIDLAGIEEQLEASHRLEANLNTTIWDKDIDITDLKESVIGWKIASGMSVFVNLILVWLI